MIYSNRIQVIVVCFSEICESWKFRMCLTSTLSVCVDAQKDLNSEIKSKYVYHRRVLEANLRESRENMRGAAGLGEKDRPSPSLLHAHS